MKVLMVEDSARSQYSLGTGLQQFDYKVDVVTDGIEAINYASSHDYDVIILDLMLPKESSLLVLHEIREQNREVEILILSAHDQIHDRVTALIQGADDYLVTPFTFDDLHARIQSLAKRRISPQSSDDNSANTTGSSAHLNRLIENLLKLCQYEHGEIELVISEVKLSTLLDRVCSKLRPEAAKKSLLLSLPTQKLPTLLVDAKWTEHLFANLISNAITQSQRDSEIAIRFHAGVEFCALEIENQIANSLSSGELKSMFKDFCTHGHSVEEGKPIARFSLARSYADCMNLKLNASITAENRFCIRISNIKIV